MDDILKTNQVIHNVKKLKNPEYRIHNFAGAKELMMFCWADAAWANRPNKKDSTEGIFVGMSDQKLLNGDEQDLSPIYWRSSKIQRICRSPAFAETHASLDGEDDLLYLRVLWFELCGGHLDASDPNAAAAEVAAAMITDAKNLYDKIHRATVCIKGAEKRSDIEAISLRENLEWSNTPLLWVHGGAMIANSLTKPQEKQQMWQYVNYNFRYKIVYDEERRSEKSRKKQGLGPWEDGELFQTHTARAQHTFKGMTGCLNRFR